MIYVHNHLRAIACKKVEDLTYRCIGFLDYPLNFMG